MREDAEATPSLADLPEAITLRFGADMFTVTMRRRSESCSGSSSWATRENPDKQNANSALTLLFSVKEPGRKDLCI